MNSAWHMIKIEKNGLPHPVGHMINTEKYVPPNKTWSKQENETAPPSRHTIKTENESQPVENSSGKH